AVRSRSVIRLERPVRAWLPRRCISSRRSGAAMHCAPCASAWGRGSLWSSNGFDLLVRDALDDVAAWFFIALELQHLARLGFVEQLRERRKAVIGLVEAWVAALERLLHHRAPDLLFGAALGNQRLDGLHHQIQRLVGLVL